MAVSNGDVIRVDAIGQFSAADAIINSYQIQFAGVGSISDEDALDDIEAWLVALLNIIRVLMTAVTIWRRFRICAAGKNSMPLEL